MCNAYIRAFNVGCGDCIFLVLHNKGKRYSIMVDCGCLTDEVKDFIKTDLQYHINILIITHIDNDHIYGIGSIIQTLPNITIDRILYNCCQYTDLGKERISLPDNIKSKLNKYKVGTNLPVGIKEIAASQALTVAELIMKNASLRNAWDKQKDYITSESPNLKLPFGFGELIFLSPEKKDIEALDLEFRKAFYTKFRLLYNGPYNDNESIYETILKICNKEDVIQKHNIGYTNPTFSAIKYLCEIKDNNFISPTNSASIAFVWECNGKSILFCGDADPNIIVRYYILKCKHTQSFPFQITAIKIPHHGSSHNSGGNFWETFDSFHIFITGGDLKEQRPSKICLARIINRATIKTRNIYYTRKNESISWFEKDIMLKKELNYIFNNVAAYEFAY